MTAVIITGKKIVRMIKLRAFYFINEYFKFVVYNS
jgi:hypothetical protein